MEIEDSEGLNAPAQSEVIGVLLILGITFASIGIIFALAQPTVSDARQDVTTDRVQKDLALLDTRLSAAGFRTSDNESVRIDLGEGRLFSESEATFMNVTVGSEILYNDSIGSIEYTNGRTSVAYEGGGLWRKRDNGSTMVSSPEIDSDGEAVTVPVYNVTTNLGVGGVTTVSLEGGDNKRLYPNTTLGPGRENPTNKTVKIAINDTDYFRAWGRYFEDSLGADVTLDESERRVEAELDPFDTPNQISRAGVSKKEYNAPSNDPFDDNTRDGVKFPSVDRLITNYVEYAESNEDTNQVKDIFDCRFTTCDASVSRVYFNDTDYTMDGGEDFDAAGSGNLTVIVDGDLTIGNSLDANVDTDDKLRIVTTGDLIFEEGYLIQVGGSLEPGSLIFQVPSNRQVVFEGNGGDGYGTVYAPDSLVELSEMGENGGSTWTGPIVGESLRADGVGSGADVNFGGSVNVRRANDSYNLYVTEKKVGIDR